MNCETNQFEMLPDSLKEKLDKSKWIPFDLREEVIVKNYRFRIESINVGENRLVLTPLGPVPPRPRPTIQELEDILASDDTRDILINADGSITVED